MPASMSRHVVFPHPEGPSSAKSSPSRISRSMPSTAVTLPNFFVKPRRRISAMLHSPFAAAGSGFQQVLLRDQEKQQHRRDVKQRGGREQPVIQGPERSEERRVGKERRAGRAV